MNEDVPKGDHAVEFGQTRGHVRINAAELAQRLAHDGELSLDGRAQHGIR